jgi:hypothetical protein
VQAGFKKQLSFGVGVVLTLSVIVGVVWYSSRPKPWNEHAIYTMFDGFYYEMSSSPANETLSPVHIVLRYLVFNSTHSDYVLSPEKTLLVLYRETVDAHPNFQIGGRFIIPAGQSMRVEVLAPPAYNTTWDVDGFVVFDSIAQYKIVFAKPTKPTAAQNNPLEN